MYWSRRDFKALRRQLLGLVTNQTGRTYDGRSTIDIRSHSRESSCLGSSPRARHLRRCRRGTMIGTSAGQEIESLWSEDEIKQAQITRMLLMKCMASGFVVVSKAACKTKNKA